MNEKEPPCRECEQDETCDTPCGKFVLWFKERWRRVVRLFVEGREK